LLGLLPFTRTFPSETWREREIPKLLFVRSLCGLRVRRFAAVALSSAGVAGFSADVAVGFVMIGHLTQLWNYRVMNAPILCMVEARWIDSYWENIDVFIHLETSSFRLFSSPIVNTCTFVLFHSSILHLASRFFTDTYAEAISLFYWHLRWGCLPFSLTLTFGRHLRTTFYVCFENHPTPSPLQIK